MHENNFYPCGLLKSPTKDPIPEGVENEIKRMTVDNALKDICRLFEIFSKSDVAILSPIKDYIEKIRIDSVTFNSINEPDARSIKRWKQNLTAWRSTIQAFKGLEAACVVLLIPDGYNNGNNDYNNFVAYIGASRATYKLIIYEICE